MRTSRKVRGAGAFAVAVAGLLVAAPSASASGGYRHDPVVSDPIVDGLAGPLQFEVGPKGKILVGQSFSGTVSEVDRTGNVTDLFNDPGVDGVARGPWGSVLYTHTEGIGPDAPPDAIPVGELRLRTAKGEVTTIASTRDFEEARNPDSKNSYGFSGLSDECAANFPPDAGILPYTGIVDSHPYAITPVKGGWLVADAGGNDILHVDWRGKVRVVAVLPPQAPVTVSEEAATANELPPCVVGAQYVAEPVPTDVEVGPDGHLYVSTLPGGPEDPSLGARGGVYKVNPWNGKSRKIADGFAGATNLAVTPWGTIYVSELFGGQVSKVVKGGPKPVAMLPSPAALEWANGKLYVGTDAFGSGKIQTITP